MSERNDERLLFAQITSAAKRGLTMKILLELANDMGYALVPVPVEPPHVPTDILDHTVDYIRQAERKRCAAIVQREAGIMHKLGRTPNEAARLDSLAHKLRTEAIEAEGEG
jgi:hypothetical protein